ncbi:MAG: tRNA-guanine transglycosylase, partial [Candidatus Thorarchaeota archaeon]
MLPANFNLKYREGLARIGEFETLHGKVQTPTLMPVLDPINENIVPISEMVPLGANIFITNAYLIYKNTQIKELVLENGLHNYLHYNG